MVGFIKSVGKGQVLIYGAANTLGDLDLVHQMALKMGCGPLFELSDWADVRLSRSENGGFLFINNYQDDPVETEVRFGEETLFGGSRLKVLASRDAAHKSFRQRWPDHAQASVIGRKERMLAICRLALSLLSGDNNPVPLHLLSLETSHAQPYPQNPRLPHLRRAAGL